MSNQLQEFITSLEKESKNLINVKISSKKEVNVEHLSFKQQKSLVTTGVDGIVGVMIFIKTLNEIILENSLEDSLKIYDRIPIVLALRKDISSKKIEQNDIEIDVNDLISQFKKFDLKEEEIIDAGEYKIILKIPTLKQENKILSICIEELKKIGDNNVGKNVSLILSYEIPKFIKSIEFGENVIDFEALSIGEKTKILDKLPANITNKISDFILKVREYDESILTFNGVTVDIDSSFFE